MRDRDRMIKDAATVIAIIKYILIIGIIGLVVYFGATILVVLLPFFAGMILARVAIALSRQWRRLIGWMSKHTRIGRNRAHPSPGLAPRKRDNWPAIIFYYLLVIALIAASFGLIAAAIGQLRSLAGYLPDLISDESMIETVTKFLAGISARLGGLLSEDSVAMVQQSLAGIQERLIEAVPGAVSATINWLGRFASNLPAIFLALVVMLMSGHYFVTDSRSMYRFIFKNINDHRFVRRVFGVVNSLAKTLSRIIGGYLLILFITFIEVLIGLLILGMPYAVVLALVTALLDFLPILGIGVTLIPISINQFINGNIVAGIGVIILYVVITVVHRFVEPPILGNAMKLHPLATLFSMILGVSAYGIGGILIGPVILVIVREIFIQFGFDHQIRILLGKILKRVGEQPTPPDSD